MANRFLEIKALLDRTRDRGPFDEGEIEWLVAEVERLEADALYCHDNHTDVAEVERLRGELEQSRAAHSNAVELLHEANLSNQHCHELGIERARLVVESIPKTELASGMGAVGDNGETDWRHWMGCISQTIHDATRD